MPVIPVHSCAVENKNHVSQKYVLQMSQIYCEARDFLHEGTHFESQYLKWLFNLKIFIAFLSLFRRTQESYF